MGFICSSAKHQHLWRSCIQRAASSHGTGCFGASSQCRWATGLPASFIQGTWAALHHMPWSVILCLASGEWGHGSESAGVIHRPAHPKSHLLMNADGCSLSLHNFNRFCFIPVLN